MITLQINHILQFLNYNIDLCLIWSSSAPTPTLMPLDCALSLPLLRAYHSTHLKHKCFRPSFMNLYNGQFDNSAHWGFRDKRCQLLMHSMNMRIFAFGYPSVSRRAVWIQNVFNIQLYKVTSNKNSCS